MTDELRKAAEAVEKAMPGAEWFAQMDRYELIAAPVGSTCINDQIKLALCATGEHAGKVVAYLAAAQPAVMRSLLDRLTAAEQRAERAAHVIRETLWMAQRYANGRQSYAVGKYNDAAKVALEIGAVKAERHEVLWALDGMGSAGMSGLTEAEFEAASEYRDALAAERAARERAEKERDEANAQADALSAKVDALAPHGSCGCSYDRPGEVCLHHSPALAAAQAEVARLREALTSSRDFMQEHWPQTPDLDTQYLAQAHFAAVDEALKETPHE